MVYDFFPLQDEVESEEEEEEEEEDVQMEVEGEEEEEESEDEEVAPGTEKEKGDTPADQNTEVQDMEEGVRIFEIFGYRVDNRFV